MRCVSLIWLIHASTCKANISTWFLVIWLSLLYYDNTIWKMKGNQCGPGPQQSLPFYSDQVRMFSLPTYNVVVLMDLHHDDISSSAWTSSLTIRAVNIISISVVDELWRCEAVRTISTFTLSSKTSNLTQQVHVYMHFNTLTRIGLQRMNSLELKSCDLTTFIC